VRKSGTRTSGRPCRSDLPAERLLFKPVSFYDEPNIDVRIDTRVTSIDPEKRQVLTGAGDTIDFDHLVLATGSRARRLNVPGADLPGVHYLRGIDDVDRIRADFDNYRNVAIVGAGYIGLEVAAVASQLGKDVTVIEMEDRVMSRVVSPELSAFYQGVHTAHGVKLELSRGVKGVEGDERVTGVLLDNDIVVPADLVVVGIGILPNTELAEDAGLNVSNGIVVDDHCQTSDPHIFAVGDCTWHPNAVLGHALRLESVHNALEQAKTAAGNICGEDIGYAQVPWFWSDQYDLKLQIAGLSQGFDQVVIRGDMADKSFACLYLRDGILISVDAVNSPRDFVQSKGIIAARARIDPGTLADPEIQLKDMI
jgi:3-phenylpropionate/trans-cinnamate dioxygenase ferredoxin reductase subunit